MDTALFNVFDLPMVLAIFISLLIASVLMISRPQEYRHLLLAAYLYAIAFVELENMIFWSMPVHHIFEPGIPIIFALGKCIELLVPLLLYLYVRALSQNEKPVSRADSYMLAIPASGIIMALLLYQVLGNNPGYYLPSNYHVIFFNPYFIAMLMCKYFLVFLFAAMCVKISSTTKEQKNRNGYIKNEIYKERNFILIGGLFACGIEFVADFLALMETNPELLNILGIMHNYVILCYVCLILVYMLKREMLKPSLKSKKYDVEKQKSISREVKKIHQIMIEHKYYLDADINLEGLANKLKMPEYQLSAFLNKNFQKNFFDFINHYRTEHAKKLMTTSMGDGYSILDVLYDSGFNSKSAFNRCFKKYTGITPSAYREKFKVTGK